MALKYLITHVVSIYQFQRTGNTEEYPASPIYQNVDACISPTGMDIQPSGDVPAFQAFEIFLYDLTLSIKNGDKIVTSDGSAYLVEGEPYVINHQYLHYIRVLARQVT